MHESLGIRAKLDETKYPIWNFKWELIHIMLRGSDEEFFKIISHR